MFEMQAESMLDSVPEPIATLQNPAPPPTQELLGEVAATSYKGDANAQPPLWEPTEPQYTKSIADYYGVSRKSVQEWFQKVKDACPWFADSDLKLPDNRYTPMAVSLMGNYRTSRLKFPAWKAQVWEENPQLVAAFQASQASQSSKQTETSANGDRPNGMVLHIGSSFALPSIASLIPTGDDAAYLTATQQRLQQFMAVQQQAIAEMHEGLQQAQACNTQHQEALSISDQLFLQEFQLKGVQLGYTALQLKQEAIRATIQAAEAGTLPLPGKPQPANGQVPSA
jgi:hypothetical protein